MAGWYVVQVPTGREEYTARLIKRVASEVTQILPLAERLQAKGSAFATPLLTDCFVPTCDYERKRRGEWKTVRLPLFPGYVVTVSDNVDLLIRLLRRVPEFTRHLRMGEGFVPLDDAERALVEMLASNEEHNVPMSYGVAEGDEVRVTSSPLKGREGLIKEVNRKRSTALLEVSMFGRTLRAKIGLAIVAKRS